MVIWLVTGVLSWSDSHRLLADQTPPGDEPGQIDAIIAGLAKISAAFDPSNGQFRIESRQDREQLNEDGKITATGWVEVECARRGRDLRAHIIGKSGNDVKEVDENIVWLGGVCTRRIKDADSITIFPHLVSQALGCFHFTDQIFVDAYGLLEWTSPTEQRLHEGRSPSEQFFLALPRIIVENRREYKLWRDTDPVEGDQCLIIEWPGHDRIWIDATHGYLVRRREFTAKEGASFLVWSNRELSEVRPGLWLPKFEEQLRYHSSSTASGPKRILHRRHVTELKSISFEPLDDSYFTITAPPHEKLLIVDGVRKMTYLKHPDGTDPIVSALNDASHVLGPRRDPSAGLLFTLILGCIVFAKLCFKVKGKSPSIGPASGGKYL